MSNSSEPSQPPQYGYAAPGQAPQGYPAAPPAPRTNTLAIVTFVLGLLGFALVPVILGHISVKQIKERNEGGMVFAVIGLVLGYVMCVVYLLLIVLLIVGGLFYVNAN